MGSPNPLPITIELLPEYTHASKRDSTSGVMWFNAPESNNQFPYLGSSDASIEIVKEASAFNPLVQVLAGCPTIITQLVYNGGEWSVAPMTVLGTISILTIIIRTSTILIVLLVLVIWFRTCSKSTGSGNKN